MKHCTACNKTKTRRDFHRDAQKKDQKRSVCKACHCKAARLWGRANRAERRAAGKRWYAARRKRVQGYMRLRAYGITPAQVAQLLVRQKNACAICRAKKPGGKGDWHVDHNHQTGKVRGMLCHRCNVGLGMFGDSRRQLRAASNYLRKHKK